MSTVFFDNITDWMFFNTVLAFIPLLLALIIFNKNLWESTPLFHPFLLLLSGIFFLFLPNAPYVITDIIHLVRQIKEYRYFKLTDTFIITGLIPEYLFFIFIGFSCYVISLQKFLRFLVVMETKRRSILTVKYLIPFFMSLGIFLGRIHRYSSWDIISHFPSIVKLLATQVTNISFYVYIIYIYIIILIGFEFFSLIYRSVFKNLFTPV